jgi:hypothetical protein
MWSRAVLGIVVAVLGLFCLLGAPTRPALGDDKDKAKTAQPAQPKELEPRPFTLQGKDLELPKVLAELAKQTGNTVEDRRREKTDIRIKLDLKNVTFWQGLDTIAKEADLRVNPYERDGKLALADGPYLAMPTSYSGLFRVTIKRLDTSKMLDTDSHQLIVFLEVSWEPRFKPLLMETRPDSLVVQDDKGRAVEVGEDGKGKGNVGNKMATEIRVPMPAPQRSALRLGVFKGKLAATGPTRMLTFTFDKLSKIEKGVGARKETKDGVTVHLRELRAEQEEDEQIWAVGLMLEYPAGGPKLESFQSSLVSNEIYLEKEKDGIKQRFPNNLAYETGGGDMDDNKEVIRYRFGDDSSKKLVLGKFSDWKIVYRIPGRMTEVPIPFEFKDVALP